MDERARALADHCRRHLGEGLRAVYTYGPDGHEVVYAREDIDYGYTRERLAALLDGADEISRTLVSLGTDKEPLGAPLASIQAFERAFVVLFLDEGRGIAVALDRSAGPELSGLLESCRDVIEGE